MATIINLPTFRDDRGALSVIEKVLPFEIKRIYWIYDVQKQRGGHRHKKAIQALVCVSGQCEIYIYDGEKKRTVVLDKPTQCLVLNPCDWHTMDHFSKGSVLLVFSSEYYDKNDYIKEAYGE